jgi:hypothetical protein
MTHPFGEPGVLPTRERAPSHDYFAVPARVPGVAGAPPSSPLPRPERRGRVGAKPWVAVFVVVLVVAAVVLVRVGQRAVALVGSGDGTFGAVTVHPPVHDVIDPARILPAPAQVDGSGGFTVLAQHGGHAVAWDPCEPIHFVVRPDNQIPGGRVLLDRAITEISKDTGLYFSDDGTTSEAPTPSRNPYQPGRYGKNWAPVLISWSNEAEYPGLAGDVVGLAGPISVDGKQARDVTGEVVFDAPDLAKIERAPQGAIYVYDVLLHELGHLVGLGHVDDAGSIMNSVAQRPLAGYSDGDLRGLEELGSGRCFTTY